MRRDIDRFAFDEQTPFEVRSAALDGFNPRPNPITLDLGFSVDESVTRIAGYDQRALLRKMSPSFDGYVWRFDDEAIKWANNLQEHLGLTDEQRENLVSGEAEPSNGDEAEIVGLYSYAGALTLLDKAVAEQADETDLALMSDKQREEVEGDPEEIIFVSRKQADFFEEKGIYLSSGNIPRGWLESAYVRLNRQRRGVGKVAITPVIEANIVATYNELSALLERYNEDGLLVPLRSSNYFNSLHWGLPIELSDHERRFVRKIQAAHTKQNHYEDSFEGKADKERRDTIYDFARVFGPRRKAIRIAKSLFSEYRHRVKSQYHGV